MAQYYILLGPPGAGKGTQATKLAAHLDIPHVSTGDMFRAMKTQDTPLARKVQEIMAAGDLVSDEITLEIVKDRLSQPDCADGCILDGFPRTLNQADALQGLLASEFDSQLTAAIMFDVRYEVVVMRIVERGNKAVAAGQEPREDDKLDGAIKRYRVYLENTAPLIGYYHAKGILKEIDGEQSIEEVTTSLFAAVDQVSV